MGHTASQTSERRFLAIASLEALVALTDPHLNNKAFPGTTSEPAWDWVGPAFVARMNEIALAIGHLIRPGLETEAASLIRALYEHAVNFAWIAYEPGQRLRQWLRTDAEEQLITERRFRDDVGEDYLPEEIRTLFTTLAADETLAHGYAKKVRARARDADREGVSTASSRLSRTMRSSSGSSARSFTPRFSD